MPDLLLKLKISVNEKEIDTGQGELKHQPQKHELKPMPLVRVEENDSGSAVETYTT